MVPRSGHAVATMTNQQGIYVLNSHSMLVFIYQSLWAVGRVGHPAYMVFHGWSLVIHPNTNPTGQCFTSLCWPVSCPQLQTTILDLNCLGLVGRLLSAFLSSNFSDMCDFHSAVCRNCKGEINNEWLSGQSITAALQIGIVLCICGALGTYSLNRHTSQDIVAEIYAFRYVNQWLITTKLIRVNLIYSVDFYSAIIYNAWGTVVASNETVVENLNSSEKHITKLSTSVDCSRHPN